MAQDPWKRAYLLDQAKKAGRGLPTAPPPQRQARGRRARSWIAALLLLAILAGGGFAAWLYRELWWPAAQKEVVEPVKLALPAPLKDKLAEEQVSIDLDALKSGLGLDLCLFSDYLIFVGKAKDINPDWQLVETGGDTWRLSAAGMLVYVKNQRIETYEVDIREIYATKLWEKWLPELRKAGLYPELTPARIENLPAPPPAQPQFESDDTDGASAPAAGGAGAGGSAPGAASGGGAGQAGPQEIAFRGDSVKLPSGWATAVYVLVFKDGTLSKLRGAVSFGPR